MLQNQAGELSQSPALTGLVSGGGRGVKSWFECRLYPEVALADGRVFDARGAGVEAAIVDTFGALVPPGGHLMLDYENPGQERTFNELVLRVPPVTSYLGFLMFKAGCRGEFKDWYFSEGGHEGPRKLQANKSPSKMEANKALRNHRESLKAFLAARLPRDAVQAVIVSGAKERAKALLRTIDRV